MAEHLLLVEHGHQVDDFCGRGFDSSAQWIALGPSAMERLDELSFSYRIPDEFFSAQELREVCEIGHQSFHAECDRMDHWLHAKHPELRKQGQWPVRFHLFPLVMFHDGSRSRLFALSRLLLAFSGAARVWIHHKGWSNRPTDTDNVANGETFWGACAALFQAHDPRIELVPEPIAMAKVVPMRTRFRKLVLRTVEGSVSGATASEWIRRKNPRGLALLMKTVSVGAAKGTVVLLDGAFEWQYAFDALRNTGLVLLFARTRSFIGEYTDSVNVRPDAILPSDLAQQVEAAWAFGGISFFPLIKGCLEQIAVESPALGRAVVDRMRILKRRYDIRAILSAGAANGRAHFVYQAARTQDVPVHVWQHGLAGANGAHTQFIGHVDCLTATSTLVWGPTSAHAHSLPLSASCTVESKVVTVGSASLDRPMDRPRRQSILRPRCMLYATTNYYQNNWYYGMPPGFSDRHFYMDQRLLAKTLCELAEVTKVRMIVKLHPSFEYLDPPWTNRIRTSSVQVVKERPSFSQLLSSVDAVILDAPTTAVLQAMAAGLPVFVLARHWDHGVDGMRLLAKRTVCRPTAHELLPLIEQFMRDGSYPADLEDKGFLQGYGTFLQDGQSAKRACDVVYASLAPVTPQIAALGRNKRRQFDSV